ncbi:single-stranded DNA-binding protein, partial [Candidatus Gottesmanbacteria bacterium]|nr:single-stranded DNA-binding protein [Candidatus Gottesmanbacteria bacterium]
MAVRSLNKVQLIGNMTRDPELRYTPAGTAVCTFGLATNRSWTTQTGELKEETEFHRIVAWNKLGELCSQLLSKGRKVYVEGRLATHSWTGQDGAQRTSTEIVIEDMIILDSKKSLSESKSVTAGAEAPEEKDNKEDLRSATEPSEETSPEIKIEESDEKTTKKEKSKTATKDENKKE